MHHYEKNNPSNRKNMSFPKKERGVAVRLEKTVRDGCSPFSITVAKEGFDGGTLLVSFWNIRDGFGFW